jgi:hypothetical protein
MNESYVIQGLTAAGTFLISLFAIFKYVINKTAKITEDSHKTIQSLSERHTSSMGNLVKESVRAQEKVANAVDSLNVTLQAQISNTPTKSDLELVKVHFDSRHDKIESKIDSIIDKKI